MRQDLTVHCNNVSKLVKVALNQNQFDALVSFEFNVGYGNFSKSTLLKLLNEKNTMRRPHNSDGGSTQGGKFLQDLLKEERLKRNSSCKSDLG